MSAAGIDLAATGSRMGIPAGATATEVGQEKNKGTDSGPRSRSASSCHPSPGELKKDSANDTGGTTHVARPVHEGVPPASARRKAPKAPSAPAEPYEILPRAVWNASAFVAFTLVVWTFFLPGSLLIGFVSGQEERVVAFISRLPRSASYLEQIVKYRAHPMVQLTHQLPGGVWAVLAPFQLSSKARVRWPRAHRLGGRLMLACSALLLGGIGVLTARRLNFHHDFTPEISAQAWKSLDTALSLPAMAGWFAGTAIVALRAIMQGRVDKHRRWMARHFAAGIWVSFHRTLLLVIPVLLESAGLVDFADPWNKYHAFKWAGYAGFTLSVVGMEVVLWARPRNSHPAQKAA